MRKRKPKPMKQAETEKPAQKPLRGGYVDPQYRPIGRSHGVEVERLEIR